MPSVSFFLDKFRAPSWICLSFSTPSIYKTLVRNAHILNVGKVSKERSHGGEWESLWRFQNEKLQIQNVGLFVSKEEQKESPSQKAQVYSSMLPSERLAEFIGIYVLQEQM